MMRVGVTTLAAFGVHLGFAGVGPATAQSPGGAMGHFEPMEHESPAGPIGYRSFEPEAWAGERHLVVLLHGCLQDAADIATATAMNEAAAERGFAVLYPAQSRDRNAQGCWNWFDRSQQTVDGDEVARIASLVDHEAERLSVPPERTHVAGISAGGAMADLLAALHPGRFGSVVVHSGVRWGGASDVAEGLRAMQGQGPDGPGPGDPRFDALVRAERPRRVLVLHGADDPVVSAVNGDRIAETWATVMGLRADSEGVAPPRGPLVDHPSIEGREVTRRRWTDAEGTVVIEALTITGLGHAWSGGVEGGSFTDPEAPSATRMILRFLGLASATARD